MDDDSSPETPPEPQPVLESNTKVSNLGGLLYEWIEAAIEKYAEGDPVLWDLALTRNERGEPAYYLCGWMPGAILGTVVHAGLILNGPAAADEPTLDPMVRDLVETMRHQRSEQISLGGSNGSPLTVPGG